ncbi:hypothetical protein GLA29479_4291 [Lysobacter antibioticus]|uniref:Uncharacterized protein n=1 Tax=Lysobacter antibioticus TaxID=84531 RepID=A0A0S2F6W5_LYSAN|nr:hypothetical protein GLA29479_4291 [Lysobacter antibioticus]ALN79303.1 hypothetical protein LA76x_1144 [Lysobacter antibioticus]
MHAGSEAWTRRAGPRDGLGRGGKPRLSRRRWLRSSARAGGIGRV